MTAAVSDLPEPSPVARALSDRLLARIAERIDQNRGVIGFDEYMHMALYEPALGYYSAGSAKLGAAGDFVTAPELSGLFGECLAHQFRDLIRQGCRGSILEFGAGSGKLCADLLTALPELQDYRILELSADLRQRQQAYLGEHLPADLFHKIEWLNLLPEAFDGIVLANEVLDAMPVHLLQKAEDWLELGVALIDGKLGWQTFEPRPLVMDSIRQIEQSLGELPEGYRTEINLNYQPWFQGLADACDRAVVVLIDYGHEQGHYYHLERFSGTMTCHYRHRVHADPLFFPGLQDITAFVDFDACADAAEACGFAPLGLVTQGSFLLANGLLERAGDAAESSDAVGQLAISQQVATLTLPGEMGEKFKVLALQMNSDFDMPAMRRSRFHG